MIFITLNWSILQNHSLQYNIMLLQLLLFVWLFNYPPIVDYCWHAISSTFSSAFKKMTSSHHFLIWWNMFRIYKIAIQLDMMYLTNIWFSHHLIFVNHLIVIRIIFVLSLTRGIASETTNLTHLWTHYLFFILLLLAFKVLGAVMLKVKDFPFSNVTLVSHLSRMKYG